MTPFQNQSSSLQRSSASRGFAIGPRDDERSHRELHVSSAKEGASKVSIVTSRPSLSHDLAAALYHSQGGSLQRSAMMRSRSPVSRTSLGQGDIGVRSLMGTVDHPHHLHQKGIYCRKCRSRNGNLESHIIKPGPAAHLDMCSKGLATRQDKMTYSPIHTSASHLDMPPTHSDIESGEGYARQIATSRTARFQTCFLRALPWSQSSDARLYTQVGEADEDIDLTDLLVDEDKESSQERRGRSRRRGVAHNEDVQSRSPSHHHHHSPHSHGGDRDHHPHHDHDDDHHHHHDHDHDHEHDHAHAQSHSHSHPHSHTHTHPAILKTLALSILHSPLTLYSSTHSCLSSWHQWHSDNYPPAEDICSSEVGCFWCVYSMGYLVGEATGEMGEQGEQRPLLNGRGHGHEHGHGNGHQGETSGTTHTQCVTDSECCAEACCERGATVSRRDEAAGYGHIGHHH